jgi:hypothetical protein
MVTELELQMPEVVGHHNLVLLRKRKVNSPQTVAAQVLGFVVAIEQ